MIKIQNLTYQYDNDILIDDLTLNVDKNNIFTLIGPSGCGKSTLLKLITGQLNIQTGDIFLTKSLKIGYLSQKNLLLPWYTVYQNITISYDIDKKQIDQAYLKKLITIFELDDALLLYPHQISGGMQSRVALLRTILIADDILLLDEPFTGLDMITKYKLTAWLHKVIKQLNKTVIYITHDIDEAISVSDQIAVVSKKPMKILKITKNQEFNKQYILDLLLNK